MVLSVPIETRRASSAEGRKNCLDICLKSNADQLLVHKFADAQMRQLAAVAGVLHAAERKVRCGTGRLVDENHPRIDLARDAFSPFDIFGHHCCTQPVRRVVSQVHRLFFTLHPEDHRDRREELLVKGWVIGFYVGEDGRFEEESTPIELLSAKQHFRAAFNRSVDLVQDTVKSSFSAERSQ